MLDGIYFYPLLTAALFHLGARAVITQPIWSRFPDWLYSIIQCSACAGTWYGFICAACGRASGVPFLGTTAWWAIVIVGLMSMVWTPIIAALHEFSMRALGHQRVPFAIVVQRADGDREDRDDG